MATITLKFYQPEGALALHIQLGEIKSDIKDVKYQFLNINIIA